MQGVSNAPRCPPSRRLSFAWTNSPQELWAKSMAGTPVSTAIGFVSRPHYPCRGVGGPYPEHVPLMVRYYLKAVWHRLPLHMVEQKKRTWTSPMCRRLSVCASVADSTVQLGQDRLDSVCGAAVGQSCMGRMICKALRRVKSCSRVADAHGAVPKEVSHS